MQMCMEVFSPQNGFWHLKGLLSIPKGYFPKKLRCHSERNVVCSFEMLERIQLLLPFSTLWSFRINSAVKSWQFAYAYSKVLETNLSLWNTNPIWKWISNGNQNHRKNMRRTFIMVSEAMLNPLKIYSLAICFFWHIYLYISNKPLTNWDECYISHQLFIFRFALSMNENAM